MKERIDILRKAMFDTKPRVCAERIVLAREAYERYSGEVPCIFRAHVFAHVLDHMTLKIFPQELIIGSQADKRHGVSFYPEYMSAEWLYGALDTIETRNHDPLVIEPEDKKIFKEELPWWFGKSTEVNLEDVIFPDVQQARRLGLIVLGNRTQPSSGVVPDHARLMREGLRGYISRCQEQIQHTVPDSKQNREKVNYWNACIIVMEAIIRYANRFGKLAEEMAESETDGRRKEELLLIAGNMQVIPEHAPQSFYQAIQFVWFLQQLVHVEANAAGCGFGRFDQYMYPYYKADLDAGNITPEEALELIECLYIKTSELKIVRTDADAKKFAGYPLWQIMMVGGIDRQGNDATNDLTYLCLEAQNEVKLAQPAIGLRIHDGTPRPLFDKAVRMIQRGIGNPAFFNDKACIPICLDKGGTLEEARDWTVVGCVEPHPGGGGSDASPIAGYINCMKALELTLHNGTDPVSGEKAGVETGDPREFKDKKELFEAVMTQLRHQWDLLVKGYNVVVPFHAAQMPVIFSSLILNGSIEKGLSVQEGGAEHLYTGAFLSCPASLADAVEAIDYAVFRDKHITMQELIEACDNDFEGNERLRQYLINKPPKFGNDIESVDKVCHDIVVGSSDYVQQFKDSRGGQYCVCNLSQTINLLFGEFCNATPDGRHAKDPLSDNSCPACGRDISGPTATVKSVGACEQVKTYDGTLFNLRFDSNGLEGEHGTEVIEDVIKTYFDHFGEHIQINVVDDATLLAAQREPEKYRGLVVRVAGYLAYFTDLDRAVQDNIIARTAHTA